MTDGYEASRALFDQVVGFLASDAAAGLEHADLEVAVAEQGRSLLCRLFQDHIDQRARHEPRHDTVVDAFGVDRPRHERGHRRRLSTIFGDVDVERRAYRRPGSANLHPADAALNLPVEQHSHGVRRLVAVEATRGSYDDTVAAVARVTGQAVGKRQVQEALRRSAADIDGFYAQSRREPADPGDIVVLSVDGKGIVMRPDSLRPHTARAAAASTTKLATRLSKGEKRNRKRMAEVGAVYDLTPVPRTAGDVLATGGGGERQRPKAKAKWVTASVVDDAAEVIAQVFDEAERRDPLQQRRWVVMVDGNRHQIDCVHAEADRRHLNVTVVVDFVHVLEYLWAAAWCFFPEADPAAEQWVHERAFAILTGHATDVAAGIRRRATATGLSTTKRLKADEAARYLNNQAAYLDYPTALTAGWPIATGVIEGACRWLVKDRMDITGARWSVDGAETVLKLRAVRVNGDLDTYWSYHLQQERHRNHESRYQNGTIPRAA